MSRMQEEIKSAAAEVFAGIDVGKSALDVCFLPAGINCQVENTAKGIRQLIRLCRKHQVDLIALEATGRYHRLPMSFVLLIDRSGSMKDVMRRVEQASRRFLDALPDRAQCALISFADDRWSQGLGVSDSRSCVASDFALGGLTASGRTNLYPALEDAYRWLNAPARAQHQRAVILITDGQVNQSTEMKARLESMKGDALTFVYFLGGQEEQWLQGLADNYLSHEGALTPALEGYFSVLSGAYAKQTILRMRPCGAP